MDLAVENVGNPLEERSGWAAVEGGGGGGGEEAAAAKSSNLQEL